MFNSLFQYFLSYVPQRSRSYIKVEDMIFKTPRKLVHSLQDLNETNSDYASGSSRRRHRSLSSGNLEWSPPRAFLNRNGSADERKLSKEDEDGLDIDNGEQSQGSSESISSTDGVPTHVDVQAMPVAVTCQSKIKPQYYGMEMAYKKTALKLVCGFSFLLFTIFTSLLWIDDHDQGSYLVPT